ncbi:MAG TPA: hypothetical protein VLW50_26425 [Streptosporangiaceae bacterium]|nr:hypothetical protein [Streptosporangiaceae bacterium]
MIAVGAVTGEPVELAAGGGLSCAARGTDRERLNLLDGLAVTVNYTTERATYVSSSGGRDVTELVSAIQAAGYTASVPGPATSEVDPASAAASRPLAWRLAVRARSRSLSSRWRWSLRPS